MAIIIPSKHIYSKNFDPVIDNNIDKLEINTKNPYIENVDGNIYNERIDSGFTAGSYITNNNKNESIKDQEGRYWEVAIAEASAVPTYITKTYAVPKTRNNRLVLSVLTGTDEYEEPNIKYSITGDIEKGNSNGYITLLSPDYPYHSPMEFGTGASEINSSGITTETYKNYDLLKDDELLKYSYEYTSIFGNPRTVDVSITLPTKTDVFTAQIDSEDDDYFYTTFSILAGIKIYKVGGVAQVDIATESEKVVPVNGTYENYIPKAVNVSFYGTYIQLNLEDEAKTININGNNVFSFGGNELIQDTNTPSIESKYQGIVDEWKNGKQTATITCPVADYYDEKGIRQISSFGTKTAKIKFIQKASLAFGNFAEFLFQEIDTRFLKQNDRISVNGVSMTISTYSETDGRFQCLADKTLSFRQEEVYNVDTKVLSSMTFRIGDIVIPYTYTNKGDKPLSYNKNFTPKQFKVVGTKISKQQGGTQELTLQEV